MAVAMAATMAIFGAGSASAVEICKTVSPGTGDGKCPTASDESETDGPITASSTSSTLTTSTANVACEQSSMTLDPFASTGTPVTAEVTALSFTGNCKTGSGTACTITVVNLPYHAQIETNSLTVTDTTGAGATVKCGFLINCTFSTKDFKSEFTHIGDDTISHTTIILEKSGGFCPATAEWHVTATFKSVTMV